MEEKVKIVEKKQQTVPETVGEKKGVGFAEQKPEENNKVTAAEEEVILLLSIMLLHNY